MKSPAGVYSFTPKKTIMELPILPEFRGVLVTGTDTDVGKTVIAAGLTAALRRRQVKAVYFKPIQSGCPEEGGRLLPTDAALARELAGLNEPLELLTPITLRLPLAPGVAAAREGRPVDLGRIAAAIRELASRYDFLVVEGAGGLYVPLTAANFLVLDLGRWLKLPLLVVALGGAGRHQPHRPDGGGGPAAWPGSGRDYPEPLSGISGLGGANQPRGDRVADRQPHSGPGAGGGRP